MPETRTLLCLTMCAYRKPGMSEEDYRKYMTEVHAPLVKGLLAKHGFVSYTMTHNDSTKTLPLMDLIHDPQFAKKADYDCIVQTVFPSVDCWVNLKKDPYYKSTIMHDHENFADTKKTTMTIGWIEQFVKDGQAV